MLPKRFMISNTISISSGARAYYLRNIMHDHPDSTCITILQQIIRAMDNTSSVVLIDDMILPDQGAHWYAIQLDLTMMSSLGAMERTEKQWVALLGEAGLVIREVWTYTVEWRDSVIVAVVKGE